MNEENPELPQPTAPVNISVNLRNFDTRDHAERFGHTIAKIVHAISRVLDLERLDGITVAFDYDDALRSLDRGYEHPHQLTRTNDARLVGVAMAAPVLRDGVVRSHLVFDADFVLPLEDPESVLFQKALYLVAHECGHVEDLKLRDICFPGTILRETYADGEEEILGPISSCLWEEYAACRLSADLADDEFTALYERNLSAALQASRETADEAIRSYRTHGDINRLLVEAGAPLCEPLRTAAYLIGHMDGLATSGKSEELRELLTTSDYDVFVADAAELLRALWSRRGRWSSPSEFAPLKNLTRDVLASGGIILRTVANGGLYIDVPLRPETTP
jgi:hypothetical protein